MTRCECLDPWHEGKPCPNDLESVRSWAPGVMSSPALCMRCLFGCEDINGTEADRG